MKRKVIYRSFHFFEMHSAAAQAPLLPAARGFGAVVARGCTCFLRRHMQSGSNPPPLSCRIQGGFKTTSMGKGI